MNPQIIELLEGRIRNSFFPWHLQTHRQCVLQLCLVLVNLWIKRFQAAQLTHEIFDHRSLLKHIFLISAKLNFHRPLVCSTVCYVQNYTPEVGGSSVWQISKKYFAGVIQPGTEQFIVGFYLVLISVPQTILFQADVTIGNLNIRYLSRFFDR